MFGPLHYEAGYAYPLIVWLHGWGDDETQLKRVMPLVSMQNFVAVAPRGTRPVPAEEEGKQGYTWPRGKAGAVAALGPLADGDAVLLKGSRVAGLERLLDLLA